MKARFGTVEVDGSAEEIAELIRALERGGKPDEAPGDKIDLRKYVSEDVAFKALKRRPLSPEQSKLLKTLKRNHPHWTTAVELQKATAYSAAQLAGLLGAFGKRVTATDGYRAGTWFFCQEWDYERDCNRYRLPDAVLVAVTRAGL